MRARIDFDVEPDADPDDVHDLLEALVALAPPELVAAVTLYGVTVGTWDRPI